MSRKPVMTEDVSSWTEPGLGTVVLGDEVEMKRFCWDSPVPTAIGRRATGRVGCDGFFERGAAVIAGVVRSGLIWV